MALQPVPPASGAARLSPPSAAGPRRALRVVAWTAAAVAALTPAAVLAGVAVRADARSRVAPPPPPAAVPLQQGSVVTPLLSLRRIPATVVAPVARRAVDDTAALLGGLVPSGACLVAAAGAPVGAAVGAPVGAPATGQPAVAIAADTALVPASNQKVLTAVAALAVLPPDHRARTVVRVAAPPDPEGAVGDLWLVGGGDRFLVTGEQAPTWAGTVEPTRL